MDKQRKGMNKTRSVIRFIVISTLTFQLCSIQYLIIFNSSKKERKKEEKKEKKENDGTDGSSDRFTFRSKKRERNNSE